MMSWIFHFPYTTFIGLIFFTLLSSCSYEKTTIKMGSLVDPTWDFSKTSAITFDENFVETKNGKTQLKLLDLEHEGDDFNSGTHAGSYFTGSSLSLLQKQTELETHLNSILPTKKLNLIGYWRMDGNYNDSSASGYNGTSNGNVTFDGLGKVGPDATIFDGTGDYISVTDSNHFSIQNLTLMAWVKINDASNQPRIIHRRTGVFGYEMAVNSNGTIQFFTGNSTDGYHFSATSVPISTDGTQWHHIALTYDTFSQVKNYFIDGALVTSYITDREPGDNDTDDLIFGSTNGSLQSVDGHIDEVAIYNSALSISDIRKVYDKQSLNYTELSSKWTPKYNNIVGYWKMDGNWQDSSGNANHGTVDGAIFSTDGRVGSQSGSFDGVDNSLLVSHHTDFNIGANGLSVSAWIKSQNIGAGARTIINKGFDSVYDGFQLRQWASSVNFAIGDGSTWYRAQSGDKLILNSWHHVIGTYGIGTAKIYIDGILADTVAFSGPAQNNTLAVKIGEYQTNAQNPFDGIIDDVALWDKVITQSEVAEIYHRQKQKYAGHYDSKVIDLGSTTSSWPDLSWSTNLPFGKELVGDFDNDTNPDSESSSDYPLLFNNLHTNLEGYWPLNEQALGSAPLGADFEDASGTEGHGLEVGGVITSSNGKLSSAVHLDGVDDYIDFSMNSNLPSNPHSTVSFWFKIDKLTVPQRLIQYGAKTGCSPSSIFTQLNTNGSLSMLVDCGTTITSGPGIIKVGNWHHFVMKTNVFGQSSLYIDGMQVIIPTDLRNDETIGTGSLVLGAVFNGGTPQLFSEGSFDEVAVWARELSSSEIHQLYRRGANRIKLQVKSCIDSTCECESFNTSPIGSASDCDGDTVVNALDFDDLYKAEFNGPGGNGSTYYSELFNRKANDLTFNCGTNTSDSDSNVCMNDEITLSTSPKPTGPAINYTNYPLSAKPNENQYFQYRVYLEADENTACNGSPCLPELTSVNLNPNGENKYYGYVQEVKPIKPLSYTSIQSIKLDADDCVSYQLSPNGTNYYYFSAGSWVIVSDETQRSTKLELENNVVRFSEQFGSGLLYLKAFLQTSVNQTTSCSIREIDVVSFK